MIYHIMQFPKTQLLTLLNLYARFPWQYKLSTVIKVSESENRREVFTDIFSRPLFNILASLTVKRKRITI